MSGTVIGDATQCPVLTSAMLRACYAMSGVVQIVGERIATCIHARGARYDTEMGAEEAEQAEAA
eukprot:2833467-Rhodomonas_salina.2